LKRGLPAGITDPGNSCALTFFLDRVRELFGDFTYMNTRIQSILIVLTLLFSGLLPKAQAVIPPPDGGYPNFTTAEGDKALFSLTIGAANTAVGWFSLWGNTEGSFNTATGAGALLFNTNDNNTAFGAAALLFNTTGSENTATGAGALLHNISGVENTATGASALPIHTQGERNTANGFSALLLDTDGSRNTAIGAFALQNSTGSNNVALGHAAGSQVTTADNVICIGTNVGGANVSNSCYIGQIFGATIPGGATVIIDNNGHLGTVVSSQRFKDQIKPMDKASEAIHALKPVTFRYKKELDPKGISQFGLVAEEVEKVNPDLVVRDGDGKVNTVRYEAINAMLLNEFLKEHRKVEKLEATVADLAAQLQKVTAQMQMDSSSAKVAVVAR
jgi:hypothetical protein